MLFVNTLFKVSGVCGRLLSSAVVYSAPSKHLNRPPTLRFVSYWASQGLRRGKKTEVDGMADDDKKFSKQLIGKTIVSKTGKRFGEIGDIIFETKSGELIHMVLVNPTPYTQKLDLERDKEDRILIPFSSLIAVGDYMVIAEEDIV